MDILAVGREQRAFPILMDLGGRTTFSLPCRSLLYAWLGRASPAVSAPVIRRRNRIVASMAVYGRVGLGNLFILPKIDEKGAF